MLPELVPENLKNARESLGITRMEAAKRMNIPQSSYVRYEAGKRKPTQATIAQMALTLGTSVDYLTGKTRKTVPDAILVNKENNPILFELVKDAQALDKERLEHLYHYISTLQEKS